MCGLDPAKPLFDKQKNDSNLPAHPSPTSRGDVMNRRFRAGSLAAVVLLGGCAITQEPKHLPVPERFGSAGGDARLQNQWWREFDDPALNALVEEALADNPGLDAVRARLRQARAVWRQTDAEAFPSLDLSVGATEGTNVTTNGVETDARTRSIGLTAGYEVDLWGRIGAQTRGSALTAAASAEAVQTSALTLTAELSRQWYAIAERRQTLALLGAQESTAAKYLEVLRLRFVAGQTRTANLLQQRDLIVSLQAEQAQTRADLATARHALAALLGRSPAQAPEGETVTLPSLPPLPSAGLPAELVQHRPDLRRALFDLRAAEQGVAVAVAQRFPRLNLTGSVNSGSAGWDGLLDNFSRTLVADLLAPLVDGGRRRAEVERSRAVVEEAVANYREAILDAFVEVEDALVREREQRLFLAHVDQRLRLSRQVLERQLDYYRSGEGDFLNVLDAQRSLQTREREFLSARRQLIELRIALYRSLAGGFLELPRLEQTSESVTHDPS